MKQTRLFGKTERTAKKDMKFASQKLLYRGGYVRELSSGRYEILPLGFRVWKKIVDMIDKEMERIGSQRLSIPILQPIDYWKKTNRDSAWGESLMKIKDRNDSEFALSATGEGIITEMVAGANPTYKDLPIIVHQFIIKFRDELRPRGGLLRVREFVMKDAYSYHVSEEDLTETYNDFHEAYSNICRSLDLEFYPVVADSGALGGDYCHEFQIPSSAGEDTIVVCEECDYAANTERAEFVREAINQDEEEKNFEMVDLPEEVHTIKDLVKHYNLPEQKFIKNVVYKTSEDKLVIGTVTGNLDVNEIKLAKAVGETELKKATEKDLEIIGTKAGYVHSWGYEEHKDKIIFVVDDGLRIARNLYGGFKTESQDPVNVNYGRDFNADIMADIAEVYDGAKCEKCGNKLKLIKTIEFGHIFKYDNFYTKHHNGYFIDKDGEKKLMYSGAYGIGIGRAMAIVVEKHHDDKGIIWPKSIAPFDAHLLGLGNNDKVENIYNKLIEAGIDILWDDRNLGAGEKFNDSDLIGIPVRLVVSEKTGEKLEWKERSSDKTELLELKEIINRLKTS